MGLTKVYTIIDCVIKREHRTSFMLTTVNCFFNLRVAYFDHGFKVQQLKGKH